MNNRPLKAVVLAAGRSTRMKSSVSKVVHLILGKEIINFLLDSLVDVGLAEEEIIVVVGDNEEEVRRAVKRRVRYARQEQQLGTAHALLSAAPLLKDFRGDLLALVGDNPYVTAAELRNLLAAHQRASSHCTFISALFPGMPPPYGRVLRAVDGAVSGVAEEIDATAEQLAIREVNSSLYAFDWEVAGPLLPRIGNRNAKKEYYLTDIIAILKKERRRIEAVRTEDFRVAIGINNRWELQEAQKAFNDENLRRLALERGVTVLQPETVTVEYGVEIGADTVLYPSTYLAAGTRIGRSCRIGPFVYLRDCQLPDYTELAFASRSGSNS